MFIDNEKTDPDMGPTLLDFNEELRKVKKTKKIPVASFVSLETDPGGKS